MTERKTKQLAKEAIVLAIEAIKDDICNTSSPEENKTRAEAIEALTRAMKNIK